MSDEADSLSFLGLLSNPSNPYDYEIKLQAWLYNLSATGVADGDKGDIVVSGGVWSLDEAIKNQLLAISIWG